MDIQENRASGGPRFTVAEYIQRSRNLIKVQQCMANGGVNHIQFFKYEEEGGAINSKKTPANWGFLLYAFTLIFVTLFEQCQLTF